MVVSANVKTDRSSEEIIHKAKHSREEYHKNQTITLSVVESEHIRWEKGRKQRA
jgi:hypothetical protein